MSQDTANKKGEVDLSNRGLLFKRGEKDVFAKVEKFVEIDMLKQANIYPYYLTIDRNEGPVAFAEGKEIIMLGSNNYLGLTIHPEVRQAAIDAVRDYGTSLTGSRLLNGTHKIHVELEEKLAQFLNKEACAVFSTGYQANLGVLTALMTKSSTLIMDEDDHASIYDGSKMCKAEVVTFKHNDIADLERVVSGIDSGRGKMIIVDGVFSMEGDVAKLPEINTVAKKYGCRLVVDCAHAVGVLGKGGRGTASHFDLEDQVDGIVGTFSKTLASVGGFFAGDEKVVQFVKHFGRSILFSASLPPASAAAAMKALEIMQREPERVDRVNDNANYLRKGLQDLGYDTGISTTPVIPIMIGDEVTALTIWRHLMDTGVYCNVVLFPAVPKDKALLRASVTSEHTRDHLDKALEIFKTVKAQFL